MSPPIWLDAAGRRRPTRACLLANSRMCGILNLRSAGIWTERRHGHHTRHAPKGLLNPPRRSLDRLSGSSLPAAHVLGPGGAQLKCKQPVGQFPRPVQKSALRNVQRHCGTCGREVPVTRMRAEHLRPHGWQPGRTLHIPAWCGCTTEYVPVPVRAGWWQLVPIWEPDQVANPLRRYAPPEPR
jgi:hypothetical protein